MGVQKFSIFSGSANPELAADIASVLGTRLGEIRVSRFSDGETFCDREADQAMFDAIKEHLRDGIDVVEVDRNINDPELAAKAVEMMLALIEKAK